MVFYRWVYFLRIYFTLNEYEGRIADDKRTWKMTTHDMTQWCDFTRGVLAPQVAESMRANLARSDRARHLVRRFERVAELARKDNAVSPPDYAVRIAKAAASVGGAAHRLARRPFTVLYDSFLQPLPATGTRSHHPSHQQVVYRAQDYTVEVRLERETKPHSQIVVGQLLRHLDEVQPVAQVPVLVLSDGRVVGRDLTSRFGEFQAAGLPPEPLQLCLLIGEEACIDVPLGGGATEDVHG